MLNNAPTTTYSKTTTHRDIKDRGRTTGVLARTLDAWRWRHISKWLRPTDDANVSFKLLLKIGTVWRAEAVVRGSMTEVYRREQWLSYTLSLEGVYDRFNPLINQSLTFNQLNGNTDMVTSRITLWSIFGAKDERDRLSQWGVTICNMTDSPCLNFVTWQTALAWIIDR